MFPGCFPLFYELFCISFSGSFFDVDKMLTTVSVFIFWVCSRRSSTFRCVYSFVVSESTDKKSSWRISAGSRKALAVAKPHRYVDPIISIAQILEIQSDYAGAIAAREEELEITKTEWNISDGETVDEIRRDIDRLKKLLQ